MKHFELAEWTDFVRGLVEKSARLPMEHHLASGCRKCRHTADLLRKLVTAVRNDSQVQVPDYALRCARVFFLLQQPEKIQILPRIPAQLLYDSFREPLPAGVRTQQLADPGASPQEEPSILDQNTILVLNQSTASILNQSTASILVTFLLDSVSRAACLPARAAAGAYLGSGCRGMARSPGISRCRASCVSVFCFRNQAR